MFSRIATQAMFESSHQRSQIGGNWIEQEFKLQ
jgi:hypothetical protein